MAPLILSLLGLVGLALAPRACTEAAWSFSTTSGDDLATGAELGAAGLSGGDLAADGRRLLARPPTVNAATAGSCQWTCGDCSGLDDSLHSALANATCTELAGDLALCDASVVSGDLLRAVQAGHCHLVCVQNRQEARCRRRGVVDGAHHASAAPAGPAHLPWSAPLCCCARLLSGHKYKPDAVLQAAPLQRRILGCARAGAPQPAARASSSAAVAGRAAPGLPLQSTALSAPAAPAPEQPAGGPASPASRCAPDAGCAHQAEWACGAQQQWRLTRAQHQAAASAELCTADLDASFCFLGRRACPRAARRALLLRSSQLACVEAALATRHAVCSRTRRSTPAEHLGTAHDALLTRCERAHSCPPPRAKQPVSAPSPAGPCAARQDSPARAGPPWR